MNKLIICVFIMLGCGFEEVATYDASVKFVPDIEADGAVPDDLRPDIIVVMMKPDAKVVEPDAEMVEPDMMPQEYCGDRVVNNGEDCDGKNVGDKACADFGFISGELRCDSKCNFDYGWCNMCGDGKVDPSFGEECDGSSIKCSIAMKDSIYSGLATCDMNCKLNTNSCKLCMLPQGTYSMSGSVSQSTCGAIPTGTINEVWTWQVEDDFSCYSEYGPYEYTTWGIDTPCIVGNDEWCKVTIHYTWNTKITSFSQRRHIEYDCGPSCSCKASLTLSGEYQ